MEYYNINNINYMLSFCSCIVSIPDISKWNVNNDTEPNNMIEECISLSFFHKFKGLNVDDDNTYFNKNINQNCINNIYI